MTSKDTNIFGLVALGSALLVTASFAYAAAVSWRLSASVLGGSWVTWCW